jgi:hypothetical protein
MPDPNPDTDKQPSATGEGQYTSGFVVFPSFQARLTLPNGARYEIQELRPHPTDPKDPNSPVWYEGFVRASDGERLVKDKLLDTAWRSLTEQERKSQPRPLQLKLNPFPADKARPDGKSPDYIGTLVTSDGAFTVFANTRDPKTQKLLLGGSIVPAQPSQPRDEAAQRPGPRTPPGPPADPK